MTGYPPGEERACGTPDESLGEGELRHLLGAIAIGDQEAMRRLYLAFYQRLWRYLWSQLDRDPGWTEEIVQDVFLAVWRSADSFRGESRVGTWLFRIAHNRAANARRAKGRRIHGEPLHSRGVVHDGCEGGECIEAASPDSTEDIVVERLMLQQALGRLAPLHRDVLDLAFYQGFRADEIAVILGIPVGTVRSRMTYARRALQLHLAQAGSSEVVGHA